MHQEEFVLHISQCNETNEVRNKGYIAMTEFAKTDLMGTNTEIHFLPIDQSHTRALSRDTKHLRIDGQVCFFRWPFFRCCKTTRVYFMAFVAPEGH